VAAAPKLQHLAPSLVGELGNSTNLK